MTITDRSSAPDAAFSAALASWESREAAEEGWEQRVERAARAIYETDSGEAWADCWLPRRWRAAAAAALSADAETPGAGEGETAAAFRQQWIADGFPWCDTCGQPAVFSEFHGNLHATPDRRFGLYPHEDPSDHPITMRDWAEQGRRERASR